jgi:hypothetical protein
VQDDSRQKAINDAIAVTQIQLQQIANKRAVLVRARNTLIAQLRMDVIVQLTGIDVSLSDFDDLGA